MSVSGVQHLITAVAYVVIKGLDDTQCAHPGAFHRWHVLLGSVASSLPAPLLNFCVQPCPALRWPALYMCPYSSLCAIPGASPPPPQACSLPHTHGGVSVPSAPSPYTNA